jgi:hypothetical protein
MVDQFEEIFTVLVVGEGGPKGQLAAMKAWSRRWAAAVGSARVTSGRRTASRSVSSSGDHG